VVRQTTDGDAVLTTMRPPPPPASIGGMFTTILVGVDGRPGGEDAIRLARRLAGRDSRLIAVSVAGTEAVRPAADEIAAAVAAAHPGITGESVVAGTVARGLTARAEELGADLLVLGACHRGLMGRVLVGDDARATLHRTSCPVALAPRGYLHADAQIRTVGVGYDRSEESEAALALARKVAADAGATVRALGVVQIQAWIAVPTVSSSIAWGDEVQSTQEELSRLGGVSGEAVAGSPASELVRFAGEVDLLVAGLSRRSLAERLVLGSVAEALAARSPHPVLLVPRVAARVPTGGDLPRTGRVSPLQGMGPGGVALTRDSAVGATGRGRSAFAAEGQPGSTDPAVPGDLSSAGG
jgi:nucleotide-binding universal stress UspA family protein